MAIKHVSKHGSASNLRTGDNITDQAWATFIFGMAQVGPSNTLKIGTGTYSETRATAITQMANGSSGNPTIVTDYGDGPVTLRRSGGFSGIVNFSEAGVAHRFITFQGTAKNQIVLDGQHVAGQANAYLGNISQGNTNFSLINLRIKDAGSSGVLFGQSGNPILRGCEIDHNGTDVTQDHGAYMGGNINALVENNEFHHNGSNGFRHGGSGSGGNLICRGNRSWQNGLGGTVGRGFMIYDSNNAQIYNNEAFLNAYAGIEVGRGTGTTVYHNACHDNRYGLVLGSFNAPINTIVKNNVFVGNVDDDFVITSLASGTRYAWNIIGQASVSNAGSGTVNEGNNKFSAVETAVWVDPNNATPTSRDYTLKAGSAAIGVAGTNPCPPVGITTDMNGNPRTGIYVDQGPHAYEVVVGPTSPPVIGYPGVIVVTGLTATGISVSDGDGNTKEFAIEAEDATFEFTPTANVTVSTT